MAGLVLLPDGSYVETERGSGLSLTPTGVYFLDSAVVAVAPAGAALGAGSGGMALSLAATPQGTGQGAGSGALALSISVAPEGGAQGFGSGHAVLSVVPPSMTLRISLTVNL